jgi:hypothetical protein
MIKQNSLLTLVSVVLVGLLLDNQYVIVLNVFI